MYGKRDPFMQTVIANQISADSGPVSRGTSSFSRDIWTPMRYARYVHACSSDPEDYM